MNTVSLTKDAKDLYNENYKTVDRIKGEKKCRCTLVTDWKSCCCHFPPN